MTTIAYRDGVLASDSRATIGSTIVPEKADKVFQLADGGAVAITGSYNTAMELVRWLALQATGADEEELGHRPALDKESTVIHLRPDGVVMVYDGGRYDATELRAQYFAWGSGSDIALGALWMGADAKTAVQAAIALNIHTGGEIQAHSVRVKKSRKSGLAN